MTAPAFTVHKQVRGVPEVSQGRRPRTTRTTYYPRGWKRYSLIFGGPRYRYVRTDANGNRTVWHGSPTSNAIGVFLAIALPIGLAIVFWPVALVIVGVLLVWLSVALVRRRSVPKRSAPSAAVPKSSTPPPAARVPAPLVAQMYVRAFSEGIGQIESFLRRGALTLDVASLTEFQATIYRVHGRLEAISPLPPNFAPINQQLLLGLAGAADGVAQTLAHVHSGHAAEAQVALGVAVDRLSQAIGIFNEQVAPA
ncbi:MAG: hypothetical protein ABSA40_11170 [Candidatus Dormibacteria bacterium]